MKNLFKMSLVLTVAVVLFSSCNCFKKMAKNRDDVQLTCTPEVLVLNNGKVDADIKVTFPVEYYNAKAVVKVTPVIVFEGGEVLDVLINAGSIFPSIFLSTANGLIFGRKKTLEN